MNSVTTKTPKMSKGIIPAHHKMANIHRVLTLDKVIYINYCSTCVNISKENIVCLSTIRYSQIHQTDMSSSSEHLALLDIIEALFSSVVRGIMVSTPAGLMIV